MSESQEIEWLAGYQLKIMEDYSEDHWAAGWMSGLEEELWFREDEPGPTLRAMAEKTGIWWTHSSHPDRWREVVALDEWKRRMAEATP